MLEQIIGNKSLSEWANIFYDYLQTIDHQFDPGHRLDHVQRVTKTAIEIANQEHADLAIVLPASILHDTKPVGKFDKDRAKASTLSAEHSIQLLNEWGYPSHLYPATHQAILTHSYSAGLTPISLEAKIVQDADRLDALGAIGIARTMAVGFKHGNPLYLVDAPFPEARLADDQTNILDHFYCKLFRLAATLHTPAAKLEAERRMLTMQMYLQALAQEIGVRFISYADYCQQTLVLSHEIIDSRVVS